MIIKEEEEEEKLFPRKSPRRGKITKSSKPAKVLVNVIASIKTFDNNALIDNNAQTWFKSLTDKFDLGQFEVGLTNFSI